MPTCGKYKTVTLKTKVEILKKVENGECKTKLAADYGKKRIHCQLIWKTNHQF